jgi:alpha-beta hydrolase superfamily lysophospholipase
MNNFVKKSNIMKLLSSILIFSALSLQAQNHQAVSFNNGSLKLNGTLSIPAGTGPFPVIILVHGSGPQDRHQTTSLSGGNAACLFPGLNGSTVLNFKDIAEYFSSKGIAVLRYDKRTFTYGSTLDPKAISYYDMVSDIEAAIDYVKTRQELNSEKVILAGHSKGGNQVSLVARKRSEVSHVIGLAAPAHGIDSLLADQYRHIYTVCYNDPQTGEDAKQQVLAIFKQVREGTWPEDDPILGAYPKFWKEWIDVTDSAVWHFQQISQPVLFIQGADDYNVTVKDAERFQQRLDPQKANVYILPGINHFLTTANNPEVDKVVNDTIYKWLNIQLTVSAETKLSGANGFKIRYQSDRVIINPGEATDIKLAEIYNLQGKRVDVINVKEGREIILENSAFPAGIYIVRGAGGKQIASAKIIMLPSQ